MMIQDRAFGRVEVRDVPLPEWMADVFGTYTHSGRVLVTYRTAADGAKDFYNVATVDDDGGNLRMVFSGVIPQIAGANGMRWMCFPDNRRILLGDYVMECHPDIDHCEKAEPVRLHYPAELSRIPGVFCRWSEIIVSPDSAHMCWTLLTMQGATNFLGRLARGADSYALEDVCVVSTSELSKPDPDNAGYVVPLPMRGGEVKQFVRGGRALTMVGDGDSISESVVQALDSEEVVRITNTPGYEETTIFSPDERLGVVMSTRFSPGTNCAVLGLVPQPRSMVVRSKIINTLYMYCVAGVRAFRRGNVGPALIDIARSREGRGYMGVDLSDPEGKWVYYSPISWHPDSARALWNERTRPSDGAQKCRLRMCKLLDYQPGAPVPAVETPDSSRIPYALPIGGARPGMLEGAFPMRIKGKFSGEVVNDRTPGEPAVYQTTYENFSDDGAAVYDGWLRVTASEGIFAAGRSVFEADLSVRGAHAGEMKLRAVFHRDGVHAPTMLSFGIGEDGLPESRGWSTYDGVTLRIEDMEP